MANDIDHLSPALTAFADAMEGALGGRFRAISICRRGGARASAPTSTPTTCMPCTWRAPRLGTSMRAGPTTRSRTRCSRRSAASTTSQGRQDRDVHMEPGDPLYLPRGQYHDALADEGGTVHIAFGITYPIGFDVMTLLFDRVAAEPEFRANLPRPDGPAGGAGCSSRRARRADPDHPGRACDRGADRGAATRLPLCPPRLRPARPAGAAGRGPLPRARQGHPLVQQGGRYGLVQEGLRAATEVPADVSPMVAWVLERREFAATLRRPFRASAHRSRSCCAISVPCV